METFTREKTIENKIDEKRSSLKVTYEKSSCYFCNEWLDTQSFKEHIIHCGQILEKCPQSCEAYVQRKKIRNHLKECPKLTQKEALSNSSNPDANVSEFLDSSNRLAILEQDINVLRSILNEEIKQRLHLITDVGSLRKHNQISDEWTQKVGNVLLNMKKCINEEASFRCNEVKRLTDKIFNLSTENENFKQFQKQLSSQLNEIEYTLKQNENLKHESVEPNCLKNEVDMLQKELSFLKVSTDNIDKVICEKLTSLENQVSHNESIYWSKIKDFEAYLEETKIFLEQKMFGFSSDINEKQSKLDCEVKGMKNIVCETEEKCEKLEKSIFDVERAIRQTHQSLLDLENHLIYEKKFNAIQNIRGHLIWRLTNFSEKFEEAQTYDGHIESPLFSNKPYGYTLRLNVFLNGIGNWKGRNIIVCLNVVAGEFDTLLSWPCKLQAEIILKNQNFSENGENDYVKTTVVKKKNDDFHSNQYIHIPHRVLERCNYLKNNSIIFEVKVQKQK